MQRIVNIVPQPTIMGKQNVDPNPNQFLSCPGEEGEMENADDNTSLETQRWILMMETMKVYFRKSLFGDPYLRN